MDKQSIEKIRSFASKNDFAVSSHLLVNPAKRSLFWLFIERETCESILENPWPLNILNNLEEDYKFKQYVVCGLAKKFKDTDYQKLCLAQFEKDKNPFCIKIIRVLNNYYSQQNVSSLKNRTFQTISKLFSKVNYSSFISEQEIFAFISLDDVEEKGNLQDFTLPDRYQAWKSKFPKFNKEGINIDLQNIIKQENTQKQVLKRTCNENKDSIPDIKNSDFIDKNKADENNFPESKNTKKKAKKKKDGKTKNKKKEINDKFSETMLERGIEDKLLREAQKSEIVQNEEEEYEYEEYVEYVIHCLLCGHKIYYEKPGRHFCRSCSIYIEIDDSGYQLPLFVHTFSTESNWKEDIKNVLQKIEIWEKGEKKNSFNKLLVDDLLNLMENCIYLKKQTNIILFISLQEIILNLYVKSSSLENDVAKIIENMDEYRIYDEQEEKENNNIYEEKEVFLEIRKFFKEIK